MSCSLLKYTMHALPRTSLDITKTPTFLFKDTFELPRIKKSFYLKQNWHFYINLKSIKKMFDFMQKCAIFVFFGQKSNFFPTNGSSWKYMTQIQILLVSRVFIRF